MSKDVFAEIAQRMQMTKEAARLALGLGRGLGKGLWSLGKGAWQHKGKLAVTGAGAAGTAAHIDWLANDQQDSLNPARRWASTTAGRTGNPFTWISPNTHQQAAQNASRQFNILNDNLNSQIDDAYASGNLDYAAKLQAMQKDQSFAGGTHALSRFANRWNPFSGGGSMAQYSRDARAQIDPMEAQLKAIQDRMRLRPEMRDKFQPHIDELNERLTEARGIPGIQGRMQQTRQTASGSPNYWHYGNMPYHPGVTQGWALNPYDFRQDQSNPHNAWEDVLQRSQLQGAAPRPYA